MEDLPRVAPCHVWHLGRCPRGRALVQKWRISWGFHGIYSWLVISTPKNLRVTPQRGYRKYEERTLWTSMDSISQHHVNICESQMSLSENGRIPIKLPKNMENDELPCYLFTLFSDKPMSNFAAEQWVQLLGFADLEKIKHKLNQVPSKFPQTAKAMLRQAQDFNVLFQWEPPKHVGTKRTKSDGSNLQLGKDIIEPTQNKDSSYQKWTSFDEPLGISQDLRVHLSDGKSLKMSGGLTHQNGRLRTAERRRARPRRVTFRAPLILGKGISSCDVRPVFGAFKGHKKKSGNPQGSLACLVSSRARGGACRVKEWDAPWNSSLCWKMEETQETQKNIEVQKKTWESVGRTCW